MHLPWDHQDATMAGGPYGPGPLPTRWHRHIRNHPGEQEMKRDEILAKLAAGDIDTEEASKLLDEVERQRRGSLYCKVSQKGGLSLYGLQRMPVTLYVEQWERLLDFSDEIKAFIEEHNSQLKRKER
jgi:hypothetical protein